MAAFKDDEIACEALKGTISRRRVNPKALLVIACCALITAGALIAVLKFKPAEDVSATPVAVSAPVPAVPIEAPAPAVKKAPEPTVIVMPPVLLPEKQAAKPAAPAKLDTATSASSLFAKTQAALASGQPAIALDQLKLALPEAREEAEKKQAAVLEGRALLALGKFEEARQKFEPLAFMTTETEAGTDALLGNFWCQAGGLPRCRSSELEQVRNGHESWGAAMAALEQARREESSGKELATLERARALYQQALDSGKLDNANDAQCLERLLDLTNRIVLDPKVACSAPKAVLHKVEPGDVLEKIVRRYKVNQGQVKRVNRLNDKLIVRLGQTLKLLPGDVVYRVDRTRLTGTLYIDGVFIRRYPVGIGAGNATPRGAFTVVNKVIEPDWYYDGKRIPFGDPKNILGTRWMGFDCAENSGQGAGLGVHGTSVPESVPGRESKGCIRMLNKDVDELYDFMPQGGKVEIGG